MEVGKKYSVSVKKHTKNSEMKSSSTKQQNALGQFRTLGQYFFWKVFGLFTHFEFQKERKY